MVLAVPNVAPIGGFFITSIGGMLGFCPYQGNRSPDPSSSQVFVDVKGWSLQRESIMDDGSDTGSFGAESLVKTGERWKLGADVILNVSVPIDNVAKYGISSVFANAILNSYNWNQGVRMTALVGDESNFPTDDAVNDASPYCYYAPKALVQTVSPIIDAAGKKMVGCHIEMCGGSLVYKMPDEQVLLTRYNSHLASRNLVY